MDPKRKAGLPRIICISLLTVVASNDPGDDCTWLVLCPAWAEDAGDYVSSGTIYLGVGGFQL